MTTTTLDDPDDHHRPVLANTEPTTEPVDPDDGTHECPATSCTRRVPWNRLACPTHWHKLPGRLKRAVTVAWREGDLDAHTTARAEAVAWLTR